MKARKAICNKATAFRAVGAAAVRGLTALPIMAFATSSITIDSVQQRWPWNNKVDITYTVTDGQNRAAGVYAGIDFTVAIPGGGVMTVNGNTIAASAETGGEGSRQHTVTWTAPGGLRAADCTITATLYPTNVPSGNDYMIVNLVTGALVYEGAFASQSDSNSRYQNVEYRTGSKMVLRKIPKWSDAAVLPNYGVLATLGGYPTGCATGDYNPCNSPAYRTPDKDYYMGVYPVTFHQYKLVTGEGNNDNMQAARNIRYLKVRNNLDSDGLEYNYAHLAEATNRIPAVARDEGSFFQRLNYRTGLYFDFPTEVMWEIAARAGATTVYHWNSDNSDEVNNYCATFNSNVGYKLPNNWGFYDVVTDQRGEYCIGVAASGRMNNGFIADLSTLGVFDRTTTTSGHNQLYFIIRGYTKPGGVSCRGAGDANAGSYCGFRVSYIVK